MPSESQKTGYASNQKAKQWLLRHGYRWIWFKPHARFADVYTIDENHITRQKDIFGLFDGIAFKPHFNTHDLAEPPIYQPVYFQVKTNAWPKTEPIEQFISDKQINAMAINVTPKGIKIRNYGG